MTQLPARWTDLTTADFGQDSARDWIGVLPVAAIEQHGPHLPLGTDAIINQGVIDAGLQLLPQGTPAVILPMQAVGASQEHLEFPGTLSFNARTLIDVWTAIAEGVRRAGLRKLLIFNSHGGQEGVPQLVATDMRARFGMIVAWASPGGFGAPEGAINRPEAAHGLHGGLKETSMLLHLRPDLVRREFAGAFPSEGETMEKNLARLRATGRISFGWQAQDLNVAGVVGDAAAATPELGARLVAHAARGFADLILDLLRFELPHP